jgi:hypothetical protein
MHGGGRFFLASNNAHNAQNSPGSPLGGGDLSSHAPEPAGPAKIPANATPITLNGAAAQGK